MSTSTLSNSTSPMSSTEDFPAVHIALAQVSSSTVLTSDTALDGVITIKWPYLSTQQKLTFLLADPDPRKRASGGQLKVSVRGPAAEFLNSVDNGEAISVWASKSVVEPEEGKVKWHVYFDEGCNLKVYLVSPRTNCR
jgi:hypothetical protein